MKGEESGFEEVVVAGWGDTKQEDTSSEGASFLCWVRLCSGKLIMHLASVLSMLPKTQDQLKCSLCSVVGYKSQSCRGILSEYLRVGVVLVIEIRDVCDGLREMMRKCCDCWSFSAKAYLSLYNPPYNPFRKPNVASACL